MKLNLDFTLQVLEAVARSFESQGDSLLTAAMAAECVRSAAVDTTQMFHDLAKEDS